VFYFTYCATAETEFVLLFYFSFIKTVKSITIATAGALSHRDTVAPSQIKHLCWHCSVFNCILTYLFAEWTVQRRCCVVRLKLSRLRHHYVTKLQH